MRVWSIVPVPDSALDSNKEPGREAQLMWCKEELVTVAEVGPKRISQVRLRAAKSKRGIDEEKAKLTLPFRTLKRRKAMPAKER